MSTTRKHKKASKSRGLEILSDIENLDIDRWTRKSRGLEILSDIENLDIMLGGRYSERENSANSNSAGRSESVTSDMFENNGENPYFIWY